MRGLLLLALFAACGGGKAAPAPDNRRQATGDGQQETGNGVIDAGAVAQVAPDAGEPDGPAPDAGLMQLGAAQCEMVFARVLACPNIGAEIKDELKKKQIEIRQRAVDPNNREEVAAACRQLTEMIEETLRRLSC